MISQIHLRVCRGDKIIDAILMPPFLFRIDGKKIDDDLKLFVFPSSEIGIVDS